MKNKESTAVLQSSFRFVFVRQCRFSGCESGDPAGSAHSGFAKRWADVSSDESQSTASQTVDPRPAFSKTAKASWTFLFSYLLALGEGDLGRDVKRAAAPPWRSE